MTDTEQAAITAAAQLMGRKGGNACKARYGHEHFVAAGRKGGQAVAKQRGPEFYSEIGKKGGASVRDQRAGTDYYARIGRAGGSKLSAERGSEYYAELGKKGAAARSKRGDWRPNARLTESQVVEMRAAYAAGGVTQVELARRYGVVAITVYNVVHGKSWRKVEI